MHATNTYSRRTVGATVSKTVVDPDGGFTGDPDFEVSLSCELNGTSTTYGPEPVKADGTVSFPDILLGSACAPVEAPIDCRDPDSVTRRTPGARRRCRGSRSSATRQGDYAFTVENPVIRVYGALVLEKVLDDPDHVVATDRTYTGGWTCTHPGDTAVSGTWTVSGPGTATLTGVPAEGILLDSTCTPTEDALAAPPSADPSYSWDDPTFSSDTTSADATASMTVTNSVLRNTVDLRIDKTVTGAIGGYTGTGADFTVSYTCYLTDTANGISGSLDIAAGAAPAVLVHDVPVGWTCRVVEDTPPQSLLVDRSYAWGTPDIAGLDGDGNVTVSGGPGAHT